ncbi:MAG TPA: EAL domain-containing protein [Rhodocyclaceae bacterium]|nr:EAL domain-containing protein [Rhodocyclaceae bacterium]
MDDRSDEDELRISAEAQARDAAPSPHDPRVDDKALLHELQVHQIELEMQNEALRNAQSALEASRDRYVDLFDFAPVAYITLSRDGHIAETNLLAARQLQMVRAELIGRDFERLVAPVDLDRWKQHAAATWHKPSRRAPDCELLLRRADASQFAAQLQCMVMDRPGIPAVMRIAFFDTTERSTAAAEIHRLAHYDSLTELPNRRLFQDRLAHAVAASKRNERYGAILFLDLDNFKVLNDTRGHDAGDRLLIEIAHRLRSSLREGDTVARMGGDEFVMILEGLDTSEEAAALLAQQVGDKLNQTIAHRFEVGGAEFNCTTSIGVRLFGPGESVEDLLKHADLALYQAKSAGRNRVRFFDPSMQAALDERSLRENALREGLRQGQFELYYQPQLDAGRRVTGAEALLRWHDPQRGLVAASDFIELAEQTDLILPLGRWVFESACAQLDRWSHDASTRDITLAVNVSARQFRHPDFTEQVRKTLDASHANPAHLMLELTESVMLDNTADSIRKMQAIKHMGIRFSIDDFGTGCSSLSYLTRLPLDQLKIDKSFVERIREQGTDTVIIDAIITMARSLGLNILAEGVETELQRDFLEARDCDGYQGFLLGHPLPLAEFERFVSASRTA